MIKYVKTFLINYGIITPLAFAYEVYETKYDPLYRFDLETFPDTWEIFT